MSRLWLFGVIILMTCSLASAAVTRTINNGAQTITYTPSTTNYGGKAYWAIEDTLSGCVFSSITCPTATGITCGKVDKTIKITGYVTSGVLPSAQVTLKGSGDCSITGQYIESPYSSPVQNPSSLPSGLITLISCSIYGDTWPACDGMITRSELGNVAQEWINTNGQDSALRTSLGLAAQNWIDNGGMA